MSRDVIECGATGSTGFVYGGASVLLIALGRSAGAWSLLFSRLGHHSLVSWLTLCFAIERFATEKW